MTKDELKHKNAVAALGCALCHHIYGPHEPAPVELHHLRSGGWGRGDYLTLIPLCSDHHRGNEGVHGLGTKAFTKFHGVSQHELLIWTREQVKQ